MRECAPPHIANAIRERSANDLAAIRQNLLNKLQELIRPYQCGPYIPLNMARWNDMQQKHEQSRLELSKFPDDTLRTAMFVLEEAMYHYDVSILFFLCTIHKEFH